MPVDRLPPLRALRVFEAAARHLSYSRAASELSLTQSAVSHQIKTLEQELGTRLFRRVGRSMLLTQDGQQLSVHVREGFARLAQGVAQVRGARPQLLSISATPSIASWLVLRLPGFYRRNPDIDVNLRANTDLTDFGREEIDLAIRFGGGKWPGLHADKLLSARVFPVASPRYRDGRLPQTAAELSDCVLLHVAGRVSWDEWFKLAGITLEKPLRGPQFNDYTLALQAAEAAQGVMLGRDVLIRGALESGKLVRFLKGPPALGSFAYYIVYPNAGGLPHKALAFRDWLLEEARDPSA